MPEIKQYLKDKMFMLEISDNELDQLLSIAVVEDFSLNEVIIAAFFIGLTQLTAKMMRDGLPGEEARLYGTNRFDPK